MSHVNTSAGNVWQCFDRFHAPVVRLYCILNVRDFEILAIFSERFAAGGGSFVKTSCSDYFFGVRLNSAILM